MRVLEVCFLLAQSGGWFLRKKWNLRRLEERRESRRCQTVREQTLRTNSVRYPEMCDAYS